MEPNKKWLSYKEQVQLLEARGLIVESPEECEEFLSQVNYYRFSGYLRYWQVDPTRGNNQFIAGSSFQRVQELYQQEEKLKFVCISLLHSLEVLIRTRFSYHYGSIVGPIGTFTQGTGFSQPSYISVKSDIQRIEDSILRDLARSKEAFISHYRLSQDKLSLHNPDNYKNLPVWVAVEALSFGSLSRLLVASKASGVLDAISDSLSTSRRDLPSQVRSFVYLRNRIAHCARLWNHAVMDMPSLQPAQVRRAKKVRDFSDLSIYKILLAMDAMASKAGIRDKWLTAEVEPLLASSKLLEVGIAKPKKYGEIDSDILLG